MKTILLTLFSLFVFASAFANTITALTPDGSPGDWDKNTTWSGGSVPQSGDIVLIPAAKAVRIKGVEYGTPPTLVIQVWGTIYFEPSGKLNLSAASSLQLFVGGKIDPKNSSSSQLITIGGVTKYNAANNGTVLGPALANILSGVSVSGQPTSGFSLGTPLSVAFTNFFLKEVNNGTEIHWETTQEVNIKYFEVEKSENEVTGWSAMGRVPAKGGTASYFLRAESSQRNTVYFRLKIIYSNGTYEYSSILRLQGKALAALEISPNPSSDFVTISFPQGGEKRVGLLNLSGAAVLQTATNAGSVRIHLAGLPAGTYFVFVTGENKQMLTTPLIVR